jgi:hypothetical protein
MINIEKQIEYWMNSANDDLESTKQLKEWIKKRLLTS